MTERSKRNKYKNLRETRAAHDAAEARMADALIERDVLRDRLQALQVQHDVLQEQYDGLQEQYDGLLAKALEAVGAAT